MVSFPHFQPQSPALDLTRVAGALIGVSGMLSAIAVRKYDIITSLEHDRDSNDDEAEWKRSMFGYK